jgi:F-type H+-transporting ATPase subunit epsilon
MEGPIELEVATPERRLMKEAVDSAQIPAKEGYLGILPGHAALAGELGAGVLTYASGGRKRSMAVAGGFLQVQPDRVRVLADVAERSEEIDVNRAKTALERAMRAQAAAGTAEEAVAATSAADRASARIAAAEEK